LLQWPFFPVGAFSEKVKVLLKLAPIPKEKKKKRKFSQPKETLTGSDLRSTDQNLIRKHHRKYPVK